MKLHTFERPESNQKIEETTSKIIDLLKENEINPLELSGILIQLEKTLKS